MKIDVSKAAPRDYEPLPPATYACTLESLSEETTRNGDPLWVIKWRISGGSHAQRCIFDRVAITDAALPRVRVFLEAMGFDVSGEIDVEPHDLIGKSCNVTVAMEEYTDHGGNRRRGNKVLFDGYARPK